jgi:hypothetical protein
LIRGVVRRWEGVRYSKKNSINKLGEDFISKTLGN